MVGVNKNVELFFLLKISTSHDIGHITMFPIRLKLCSPVGKSRVFLKSIRPPDKWFLDLNTRWLHNVHSSSRMLSKGNKYVLVLMLKLRTSPLWDHFDLTFPSKVSNVMNCFKE